MSFGLDYVSGPGPAELKAAGVTFVCRYLSFVNNLTQVKLLTPTEAQALSQAGIAIVSNYEWYASRALEGFASGVTDAQIARDQHAACGGPADRPIYFSVDADVQGAQVLDYFKGVASVIGLARTGAYGSYRVLQYLFDQRLITWGWQTYAWSNGAWEPRAHIQQYSNGQTLAGHSVDYDRSMRPDFGQWFSGGSMQQYSPQSADFGTWFTATDADHWTCKQNGHTVQYGIKSFFSQLSMDGQSLPLVGLPLTNEIYIPMAGGKQVVLQVFERAAVFYDPAHLKDSQPGMGDCYLCHLNDPDVLKNVPGLVLPTQSVDTSTVESDIRAIADALATPIAKALADLKKL